MRLSTVATLLLLGPGIFRAAEGRAESVSIKPTQVHLSGSASTALLSVRNDGKGTARFQLSASSWRQDEKGEMVLTPTKDVVFFPTFVVLPPGSEKKVRIGTSVPFGDTEKTYRVFFEELPPPETEVAPGRIAVLTRVGVPVFLQPAKPVPKGGLTASAAKGSIQVTLKNEGNAYLVPSRIAVRFLGADGKPQRERALEGWYILAGGTRRYDVVPSREECAGASAVVVEASLAGETISTPVDPAAACPKRNE